MVDANFIVGRRLVSFLSRPSDGEEPATGGSDVQKVLVPGTHGEPVASNQSDVDYDLACPSLEQIGGQWVKLRGHREEW